MVHRAAGRRQRGGQARGGGSKDPEGKLQRFQEFDFLPVYSARLAPCKAGAADLGAAASAADPYWLRTGEVEDWRIVNASRIPPTP